VTAALDPPQILRLARPAVQRLGVLRPEHGLSLVVDDDHEAGRDRADLALDVAGNRR
jgi:hypothetical protein